MVISSKQKRAFFIQRKTRSFNDSRWSNRTKDKIDIERTVVNQGLEVNPDYQLKGLELNQSIPAKIKIGVSVVDSLVSYAIITLRRIHL